MPFNPKRRSRNPCRDLAVLIFSTSGMVQQHGFDVDQPPKSKTQKWFRGFIQPFLQPRTTGTQILNNTKWPSSKHFLFYKSLYNGRKINLSILKLENWLFSLYDSGVKSLELQKVVAGFAKNGSHCS